MKEYKFDIGKVPSYILFSYDRYHLEYHGRMNLVK